MKIKPCKIIGQKVYYQCNVCKSWFEKNGFYSDNRNKTGITSSCKTCHKKTSISTRNKERARERDKISRYKRKEKERLKFRVNDFEGEIWKEIPNTRKNYFVSNLGRVKSTKWGKGIILKQGVTEKGYLQVCLNYGNFRKSKRVHRLVAEAFIPNPNGYKEINHKDENKLNNMVENLEWCDRKYNMNYGTVKERIRKKQSIRVCL